MALIDFSKSITPSDYQKVGNDYLTQDEIQNKVKSGQIEEINIDPNQGDFSRGLTQGTNALKSAVGGVGGLFGDIIGSDSLKQSGLNYANKKLNINQLYAKDTDQLQNVKSLSGAGSFLANQIGQQIPGLVAGLATGGVGAVGTGVGVRLLARKAVDNAVEQQIAKSALINSTGFKAGLFGFGAQQSAGTIYPDAIKNNNESPIFDSLAGGAIGGALNFIGDYTLLNSLRNPISGGATRLGNIARGVSVDAGVNAGAGLANTFTNRGFGGLSVNDEEAKNAYINALAGGAIAGAPFGLSSGFVKPKGKIDETNTQPIVNGEDISSNPDSITNKDTTNIAETTPIVDSSNIPSDPFIDNSLSNNKTDTTSDTVSKRSITPDLSTNEYFQNLAKDNPNLLNIKDFNEKTLTDNGVSSIDIKNIKNEFKTNDLLNTEIGGKPVNELISGDTSSLSRDQINSYKKQINDFTKNYEDRAIDNNKLAIDTNRLIEENYIAKTAYKDPNSQAFQEVNTKQQEQLALQDSTAESANKTDFSTPVEKARDIIDGPEVKPLINTEEVTPQSQEIVKQMQEADPFIENVKNTDKNEVLTPIKNEEIITDINQPKNEEVITQKISKDDLFNKENIQKFKDDVNTKVTEENNVRTYKNGVIEFTEKLNKNGKVFKKEWNSVAKEKGVEFSQRAFEKNTLRGQTKTFSDKLLINKVNNDVSARLKNANVNSEVLSIKDSPFLNKNIDGYYDRVNDKIVIFAENYNKDTIQEILNHELTHAGLYKMTKGYDRIRYESELENIAKNKELNDLAIQIQKDFPEYTRLVSINEALAKMAENGSFRRLNGIEKFMNYVKSLVNKILGREQITSLNQVQDYIAKAHEFTLTDADVSNINSLSNVESLNHVNDYGNLTPQYLFSEKKYTEQQVKDFNADFINNEGKIKSYIKGVQDKQNLIRNSDEFHKGFEKASQELNRAIDSIKDKKNLTHSINKVSNVLNSVRHLASKHVSTQMLQNIFDMGNTINGVMQKQTNDTLRSIARIKISDTDDTAVNAIIRDASSFENQGNGKRLTIQEVKDKITQYRDLDNKPISDMNKAFELYSLRRKALDDIIDKTALEQNSNIINKIERLYQSANLGKNPDGTPIVRQSDFVNNLKLARDKVIKSEPKYNKDNINENFTEFFESTNFKDKIDNNLLQLDLNIPENVKINEQLKEFITQMGKNNENSSFYKNDLGYAPKDHSGKFVIKMSTLLRDESGDKEVTFGVQGFKSAFERNSYIREYQKMLNDMAEKNILNNPNMIKLISEDRQTETFGNISADQFLNQAERAGVNLDADMRKQIMSVSNAHKVMERTFKEGIGQSTDFDRIISQHQNKLNKDISRSVYHNDEIGIFRDLKPEDGPVKDMIISMQNAKLEINNNDKLTAKLRGFGSMWMLGWNMSSAGLQTVQFFQAAPSWLSQYTGGTGIQSVTSALPKAFRYLKDGTTGNKALDLAIKDFTNPLLGAEMSEMLFNVRSSDQYSKARSSKDLNIAEKLIKQPFFLFSKAEEMNRISTFIASHEIYHNQAKYNPRIPITGSFHEFAINNLIRVNGDYSAYNRPKILKGDVAQTVLMFQQYKVLMGESFKVMDTNAKWQFLAMFALTAGIQGLPFAQNIEDSIDYFSKLFGNPINSRKNVNDSIANLVGSDFASTWIQNGLFPSIGSRAGLGEFIPFIGSIYDMMEGNNVAQSLQKQLGPTATLMVNMQSGLGNLLQGDVTQAVKQLSPSALKNIIKGGNQMLFAEDVNGASTGKGINADRADGFIKMLGFQSVSALDQQKNQQILQISKDTKKNIGKHFQEVYLRYRMDDNSEMAEQTIKDARMYNQQEKAVNSGLDFKLDIGAWNKNAKQAKLTQYERTLKDSDKSIQRAFNKNINNI